LKIIFPDNFYIQEKARQRLENAMLNAVATLSSSKNLDIAGLSEVIVVEKIKPSQRHTYLGNIGGEVVTNNHNPLDFTIRIVGTIFDLRLMKDKEIDAEFINALQHELAHVHDHNKIPHIYAERTLRNKTLSQENAIGGVALRIWSEFIATQLSSNGRIHNRVENKIKALNQICQDLTKAPQEQRCVLIMETLCSMAYFLGDIFNHEELANEITERVDIGQYTSYLGRLDEELCALLETYPQWRDMTALENLKNIVHDFFNATYNNKGESA